MHLQHPVASAFVVGAVDWFEIDLSARPELFRLIRLSSHCITLYIFLLLFSLAMASALTCAMTRSYLCHDSFIPVP